VPILGEVEEVANKDIANVKELTPRNAIALASIALIGYGAAMLQENGTYVHLIYGVTDVLLGSLLFILYKRLK
jgi:hypothetical protein